MGTQVINHENVCGTYIANMFTMLTMADSTNIVTVVIQLVELVVMLSMFTSLVDFVSSMVFMRMVILLTPVSPGHISIN